MQFIRAYFNAERAESFLFIGIGLAAIFTAGWLWFQHPAGSFYRGMAFPLAGLALIQLVVGGTILLRTPADICRVETYIKREPEKIKTEEIPRIEAVLNNFGTYRQMELTLAIAGLLLILLVKQVSFWKGVGAGLFLQAGILLILDFWSEQRGKRYLKMLSTL